MDDVTMSRDQLHSRKVSFEINQPSIVVSPPEESTLSPPNEEKEKKVDEYRNWGQGYGEGGGGWGVLRSSYPGAGKTKYTGNSTGAWYPKDCLISKDMKGYLKFSL